MERGRQRTCVCVCVRERERETDSGREGVTALKDALQKSKPQFSAAVVRPKEISSLHTIQTSTLK